MNKKNIVIVLMCLVIISGCNSLISTNNTRTSYSIKEKTVEPWKFSEGVLWENAEEQGFEYGEINYVNEDSIEFTELFLLFYINYKDEEGNMKKDTLFTYSEGQSEPRLMDKEFKILSGGISGEILRSDVEYDFEEIFVDVTIKNNTNVNKKTYRLEIR